MAHFDMTDLRLFVQIAETNSLRQGAERACLSAPAASTRIINLEARSGTKLLTRSSRGVTLTTAGQALLHHAKVILDQIETLNADLEEYAKSVKGHLRVGANPTGIKEFLPSVLQSYLVTHPDVRLDLREMFSADIVRSVSAGTLDVGVLIGNTRTEDLEVLSYRETRLVLVTPLDHPLAKMADVSFAEALQYEFVDFPETSPTYWPVHRAADELATPVRTRVRAVNVDTLCLLVQAGIGVGVGPEPSVRRLAQTSNVAVVPISDDSAMVSGAICARKFRALPSFARDFVAAMLADAEASTEAE